MALKPTYFSRDRKKKTHLIGLDAGGGEPADDTHTRILGIIFILLVRTARGETLHRFLVVSCSNTFICTFVTPSRNKSEEMPTLSATKRNATTTTTESQTK